MRFVIPLLLALAVPVAALPACAHTTNVVKDCSAETAVGLIDDVNTAVATHEYTAGLAKLVAKFGSCVIEKAAIAALKGAGIRAKYDELEALKAHRLREWLDSRGVKTDEPVSLLEEDTVQQALINHSKNISDTEIACIAEAVNRQLIECANDYSVEPQPMAFYSTASGLPARSCRIMDIVDTIDNPGALGYHTNEVGVIYGRVLARDVHSTSVTVSHEALEMLIDPSCARWRSLPDGFAVALEVCDPVQSDKYFEEVDVAGVRRSVALSNYVLPRWFEPVAGGAFDRMRRLTAPFEMTPGGYIIVRDGSGKQSNRWAHVRFGGDQGRMALGSKFENPDGRLARRLLRAA